MKFLLDTHLLVWASIAPKQLSAEALTLIHQPDSELLFSVISLWEVAVKRALGRADFDVDPRVLRRALLDNGYTELTVTSAHALAIDGMPAIHKDPFDRMLIAQATVEGIALMTTNATIARYSCPLRRV